MNPEFPDKERSPVPKRRWRPLDQPDRRTMELPLAEATLAEAAVLPWSGH